MNIQDLIAQGYRWVGINGKLGTGDNPSTGDVLNFLDAQGHPYEAKVDDADAGTLSGFGPSRPQSTPTHAVGASVYQPANAIAPHASAAEKAQYEAIRNDSRTTPQDMISAAAALRTAEKEGLTASGKDADTQALAQHVKDVLNSGNRVEIDKLNNQDWTAYYKVNPPAGSKVANPPSQWQMPVDGYTGPLAPHHAGNPNGAVDLEVPLGTPVKAMTSGTITMSKDYGTAGPTVMLQTDDGHTVMYQHLDETTLPPEGTHVDGGTIIGKVGPVYPGEHSTGPHLHVAIDTNGVGGFETENGTATNFDTLGFMKSLAAGKQPVSDGSNPFTPLPEIHWNGSRAFQRNPDGSYSVVADFSGLNAPAHFGFESGGRHVEMAWDPKTKQFTQAFVGDLSPTEQAAQQGKFLTLLQQADATRAYIKQQYLAGTITAQQMADYGKNLDSYTQAALQGSTPWQMYYQEQQLENNRATTAKDLLDTAMTQTNTAANDLLSHAITGTTQSKYGVMPDNTLTDLYQGSLNQSQQQAKPLTDLAQALLQGIGAHAQAAGLDPRIPVVPGGVGSTPPPPSADGSATPQSLPVAA